MQVTAVLFKDSSVMNLQTKGETFQFILFYR